MLLYLFFGFICGGLIPFLARRFGKLIPMDPGLILLRLFHAPHFPTVKDKKRRDLLKKLWCHLWISSILWGLFSALLFSLCKVFLPDNIVLWGCVFCWIQTISMLIDAKYWLLPDFFTIPLILLGFLFSYQISLNGVQFALLGSIGGYLVCVFSVFFMGLFSTKTMFGGGDLKMITALGTWLGLLGLNYTLIFSFLLFVICNFLPFQKKGAYGPALGLASMIVFFLIYLK